jgi:hypothetical protein
MTRPNPVQILFVLAAAILVWSLFARLTYADPRLSECFKFAEADDVVACECRAGLADREICEVQR